MTRTSKGNQFPCPLCGSRDQAHSRLSLADIEPGRRNGARYHTVICRDCAVAMVLRTEALLARA